MRRTIVQQNRRVARRVGRQVAEQLHQRLLEPGMRGPAFRWATFGIGEHAEIHLHTSRVWRNATALEPVARNAAERRWRLLCALHGCTDG